MSYGRETGRVLVVESDMASRFALRSLFRSAGWVVALASSVFEAQRLLDPPPDWIVLNTWLPDGEGAEVLRAAHARGLSPRVAILTESPGGNPALNLEACSPDLLMPKPIAFDRLLVACTGETEPLSRIRTPRWVVD